MPSAPLGSRERLELVQPRQGFKRSLGASGAPGSAVVPPVLGAGLGPAPFSAACRQTPSPARQNVRWSLKEKRVRLWFCCEGCLWVPVQALCWDSGVPEIGLELLARGGSGWI